ncbi:hypothetical protein JCM14469_40870 [Desulfatiferula olefinivorans]
MTHNPRQPRSALLERDLEYRILKGLSLEWDAAMDMLPDRDAVPMKKPIFSLKNGEKNLAHWNPLRREIAFSRTFVTAYPWDAVQEVLIHEMAHQYAHEVLGAYHETAHGPAFHEACKHLRANPEASGTYRPLTDRINAPEQTENDRILLKIQKLLALGQSKNAFEAQAALTKARALMDRFKVEIDAHSRGADVVSMFIGRPVLRHFREEYILSRLLIDHYSVYGIWIPSYVMEKGKMGTVLEISGRIRHVTTAAYAHDFIVNQIDMAWDAFRAGRPLTRSLKTDFACGLIQGFSASLEKDRAEARGKQPASAALIPIEQLDPGVAGYIAFRYPRTRNFRRKGGAVNENIRQQGRKIGESLVLAPGINAEKSPRALPEPRQRT